MGICVSYYERYNPDMIIFGYITAGTIVGVSESECYMSFLYFLIVACVILISIITYIWRTSSRRMWSKSCSPSRILLKLNRISKKTLADYVTDSPNWRIFLYLVTVGLIIWGPAGVKFDIDRENMLVDSLKLQDYTEDFVYLLMDLPLNSFFISFKFSFSMQ